MKKLVLVLSVIALVGASSCKKSYTCTCVDNNANVTSVSVKASSSTDAVTQCANQSTSTKTCAY